MDYKNKYFKYKKKYNNLKLLIDQRGGVKVNDLVKITDGNKKTWDDVKNLDIYKGNVIKPGQIYFSFNYNSKNEIIDLETGMRIINLLYEKAKQAEEVLNEAKKAERQAFDERSQAYNEKSQAYNEKSEAYFAKLDARIVQIKNQENKRLQNQLTEKQSKLEKAEKVLIQKEKVLRQKKEVLRQKEEVLRQKEEVLRQAEDAYQKTQPDYNLKFNISDKNNNEYIKFDNLQIFPILRNISLEMTIQEYKDNKFAEFMLKYLNKNTTYYLNNDIIINVTFNENINDKLKNEIIQIIENYKL